MTNRLVFFTDPHMGLNRARNTTPSSMLKMREAITQQVKTILATEGSKLCLGDWFDNYSNPETVLKESVPLLRQVDLVISGNHDQVNIKDRVGSLELLSALVPEFDAPRNEVGESKYFSYELPGLAVFTVVPHCSTQALFEQALEAALPKAKPRGNEKSFLLLHCNYDNRFAEKDENSLNLTKQVAAQLLDKFDYVMLGHEHQPRDDFGGRLIVLGNTHPTGFADISDKRIAVFENGKLEFKQIWSKADNYIEVPYDQLQDSYPHQFIRIVGGARAALLPEITKAARNIQANSPNLLALKLDVSYEDLPKMKEPGDRKKQTLIEIVEASLAHSPDLLAKWKELV